MGKNYYAILGVKKDATDEEIKRSFRTLALKFHPDKNKASGADNKFKEIAEAYEILIDKSKRGVYDQYGEEGLKGESVNESDKKYSYSFHGDAKATFAQFFGPSNPFQKFFDFGSSASRLSNFHDDNVSIQDPLKSFGAYDLRHGVLRSHSFNLQLNAGKERNNLRNSVVEHDLFVSLEDILNGCVKKVKIFRSVMESNNVVRKEEKVFTINVQQGWKAGTKVIFQNEGNQEKNKVPADVLFVIRDKPHPYFKREGSNIKYVAKISLRQALCGCEVEIPTLTGEFVRLNLKEEILSPQITKKISGFGLPHPKESHRRGDLIVIFDIKFPNSLPRSVKNILSEVLSDSFY